MLKVALWNAVHCLPPPQACRTVHAQPPATCRAPLAAVPAGHHRHAGAYHDQLSAAVSAAGASLSRAAAAAAGRQPCGGGTLRCQLARQLSSHALWCCDRQPERAHTRLPPLPRHRSDELLSYDTYDEGMYCRSRIWLLMAYALSLGAIAGSVLVMLHRGGEVSSILQVGGWVGPSCHPTIAGM